MATIECVYNRKVCVTEEASQFLPQDKGTVTTFMTLSWEVFGGCIINDIFNREIDVHVTDISEIFYDIFLSLSSKSSSELQTDLQCLLLNL